MTAHDKLTKVKQLVNIQDQTFWDLGIDILIGNLGNSEGVFIQKDRVIIHTNDTPIHLLNDLLIGDARFCDSSAPIYLVNWLVFLVILTTAADNGFKNYLINHRLSKVMFRKYGKYIKKTDNLTVIADWLLANERN